MHSSGLIHAKETSFLIKRKEANDNWTHGIKATIVMFSSFCGEFWLRTLILSFIYLFSSLPEASTKRKNTVFSRANPEAQFRNQQTSYNLQPIGMDIQNIPRQKKIVHNNLTNHHNGWTTNKSNNILTCKFYMLTLIVA